MEYTCFICGFVRVYEQAEAEKSISVAIGSKIGLASASTMFAVHGSINT